MMPVSDAIQFCTHRASPCGLYGECLRYTEGVGDLHPTWSDTYMGIKAMYVTLSVESSLILNGNKTVFTKHYRRGVNPEI